MEKLNVYAMYDTASSQYGLPFFAINDLVARRQTCITLSSLPIEYWKDFQLFLIGTYDQSSGEIYTLLDEEDNRFICGGTELVKFFENMYKENKK